MDEELFEGTAKLMEGFLAGECYKEAREDGCMARWGFKSSKSVLVQYPEARVSKCGGHVGRAHHNNLK